MKKLEQLKQGVIDAKYALEMEIFAAMDRVARANNVDKMNFGLSTFLFRKGKEVEVEAITKLDEMYCDYINRAGFQALWSAEEGWY